MSEAKLCFRPTHLFWAHILKRPNFSHEANLTANGPFCVSFLKASPQALVSFKKYMPPPLPYFKVNICPLPLPHFASIFFAFLWSFRWPNYIVTLPRYFSFRLPHLDINTGPPQTNWTIIFSESRIFYFSVTETDSHFRSVLNWFRNWKKGVLRIKCQ